MKKPNWENSNHVWKRDGAEIDSFVGTDWDIHNGPLCTVCGYTACWHCVQTPPPCPGKKLAVKSEEKPVNVPGKYVRDLVEAANRVVYQYVLGTAAPSIPPHDTEDYYFISAEKLESLKKACENINL